MKFLLKYLKKYWFLAILGPVLMMLEVFVDLYIPKLSASLVNNGVLKQDMELILNVGLKMMVFVLLGGFLGITSGIIGTTVSQKVANDMRKDVFNHIMHFTYQDTDKFTTGSLTTRISNDITVIQQVIQMSLRLSIRVIFMFTGGIVMMLTLNVEFGTVLLIALPVLLGTAAFFLIKSAKYFSVIQTKMDRINTIVQENVTGARVVKAFNNEEYEMNRFDDANHDLGNLMWNINKLFAFLNPFVNFMFYGVIIIVYIIGSNLVDTHGMLAGDVMAAITYINMILMAIMMFTMVAQFFSRSSASLKRINEVLNNKTEDLTSGLSLDEFKSLEFKNVNFGYNDTNVLRNINFDVKRGETIGIIGGTGSGKSSLLNLIPRFYNISGGEILLNGKSLYDYDLIDLRNKISFVSQSAELYTKTIKENVMFGKDNASVEELNKAIKVSQSESFINNFKDGINTDVLERGNSLSGGQKQRLSIARSLIKNSDLLILDDASSALDLKTEAMLYEDLKTYYPNITKIIVAQRISSIKNSNKIIVLDDGEIKGIGTHDELLNNNEIYKNIYDSQLKSGGVFNE